MSVELLDCTLRDGGYLNQWKFGRRTIPGFLETLDRAGVDVMEVGFLTGEAKGREYSLFASLEEVARVLPRKKRGKFVAMVALGELELDPGSLPPFDGETLDGVRLSFRKGDRDKAFRWARELQDKGYPVFFQPVGTVFYSDLELLHLVEQVNILEPYAFYVVDTLGSMYREQVTRRFHLLDENLAPGIRLGLHGHNNLQLAFANAQAVAALPTRRPLVVDSSVFGMGRGAGNLPTELMAQYLDRTGPGRYDVSLILEAYDRFIAPLGQGGQWGYSVAYHIAASHLCHPNYAAYLLEKGTLSMKELAQIVEEIPRDRRAQYDQDLIAKLYRQRQTREVDDGAAVEELTKLFAQRPLLLLGEGACQEGQGQRLREFIARRRPVVVELNFRDAAFPADLCFFTSRRGADWLEEGSFPRAVVTSNVAWEEDLPCLWADYRQCLGEDALVFDAPELMALKFFQRCGVGEAYLAGFPQGAACPLGRDCLWGPRPQSPDRRRRLQKQLDALGLKIVFLHPRDLEDLL